MGFFLYNGLGGVEEEEEEGAMKITDVWQNTVTRMDIWISVKIFHLTFYGGILCLLYLELRVAKDYKRY